MDVPEQVEAYLASQPEPKQADLRRLHAHILAEYPGCRLWFTDGTNADGKVVANPNIGYGACTITYADGSSREFYRIGLSASTAGISVYVLGLDDKRVPPRQSEEMVEAMHKAGKFVEYVTYPGEGHGWRKVATIIDDAHRTDDFLVRKVLNR